MSEYVEEVPVGVRARQCLEQLGVGTTEAMRKWSGRPAFFTAELEGPQR